MKKRPVWRKKPAGVGTPADVVIPPPTMLCITRKVSGFANKKKTRVL